MAHLPNKQQVFTRDDSSYANRVRGSPSVSRILEGITPRGVQEHYRDESETAIGAALPGTHTAMAHDDRLRGTIPSRGDWPPSSSRISAQRSSR